MKILMNENAGWFIACPLQNLLELFLLRKREVGVRPSEISGFMRFTILSEIRIQNHEVIASASNE
ncbi:MAG: hypothetical protein ONA90_00485 [candidate division KSB1 bacterium]|nr:hypothetical protein [candidate division KSB1 bacterium]